MSKLLWPALYFPRSAQESLRALAPDIRDAIDFNQHAGRMPKVAAHSGAHRIGLGEPPRIHRVVSVEKAKVAEVDVNFHHVPQRGAIRLQDRQDVLDRLVGLLFNSIAYQFPGRRIVGASSGHKNKISRPPSLRVGAARRRSARALNFVLSHVVLPVTY